MTIIFQLIAGLIILGVLVLIHELGHFLIAKLCRIRVLAFSIGFGKRLFSFHKGGTEYRICAFPFGGYVHMAGEYPEDQSDSLRDTEGDTKGDDFLSKPVYQRAAVAIAGPAANIITAFIFIALSFTIGVDTPYYLEDTTIGWVETESAGDKAGLKPGDRITSIDGKEISSWKEINQLFQILREVYLIEYERDNSQGNTTLRIEPEDGEKLDPSGGIYPAMPPVVGSISPDSPAEKAGLAKRDSIIGIDSVPVHSWYQVSAEIGSWDSTKAPITLALIREGDEKSLRVEPEYSSEYSRYLLGISAAKPKSHLVSYPVGESLQKAFGKCIEYSKLIFITLERLITGHVSHKQMAGPVGIIQVSGVVAASGISKLLNFMGLIGINLAIINLFPLIITDGGVLLFLLIELIRGKPLERRIQLIINRVAISFFISLFILITINDLIRIPELLKISGGP